VSTHKYLEKVAVEAARGLASGELKVDRTRPLVDRVTNAVLTNKLFFDNIVLRQVKAQVGFEAKEFNTCFR